MSETTPKAGPTAADSPEVTPETAKVFDYDVASNARTVAPSKPNPASPLAAGWYVWKRSIYSQMDTRSI